MMDVDWHCHSTWSDGQGTLAGLARRAAARGKDDQKEKKVGKRVERLECKRKVQGKKG